MEIDIKLNHFKIKLLAVYAPANPRQQDWKMYLYLRRT